MEENTMKNCPNCGHELPDDAPYCPACGTMIPAAPADGIEGPETPQPEPAPVENVQPTPEPQAEAAPQSDFAAGPFTVPETPVAPTPARSGGGKKAVAIGLAALLAVGCIGTGVFFLLKGGKGPSTVAEQFKAAQTQYVNDLFTPLKQAMEKKNTQTLSTDLTVTAQYLGDDMIASYLENSSIGLKMDIKEDSTLLGLDFTLRNTPIVSSVFTYEDGVAGLCVPELAETWYTADLVKFVENSAQGETIPDLSKLSVPKYPVDSIQKICVSYLETLMTAVTDNNIVKEERATFSLALTGGNAKGDVYTVTPTAKELEAMLLKLADQLETDPQLVNAIYEFYGSTLDLFDETAQQSGEKTLAQQLNEILAESAVTLREDAAEFAEALEAEHFTWTLYTDGKKTSRQVISADSFELSWESSGDGMCAYLTAVGEELMRFEFGKEALLFSMTSDGETIFVDGTYKEEKGLYTGQLHMGSEGFLYVIDFYDVDPKKSSVLEMPYGSYAFTITDEASGTGSIYLDVAAGENGGTDHVFRFDFAALDTEEFRISDLTVCVNSSDKASTVTRPDMPVTDVTYYTEDDFNALGESLAPTATQIFYKLYGALYIYN